MGESADDAAGRCPLLADEAELERAVGGHDRLFVLVYASWCPFSRMFLPDYVDQASGSEACYRRILADGNDPVVARYGIEVFPTVLFFERGRLTKRLDGVYHRGLDKAGLSGFVRRCVG